MKILSLTPFKFAPLPGRLKFPGHSLTLIVKGTFDLKSNGTATLSGEQLSPTGDEFYPDDEEKTGSPRYESEFAYLKLRADVLLVGACHTPNGRPAVSCPATFRVGGQSRPTGIIGLEMNFPKLPGPLAQQRAV